MRLQTLRMLLCIHACGSLRAASEQLHISQPALTLAIQQLEGELGCQLLVRTKRGVNFGYKLGVMVETPRAALRAGDIAQHAAFLSFGTNDLTQMTYGLSRDDAGRFMSAYVQAHVYPEDPFHTLDVDGVGELLSIGAERGRAGNRDVVLSICGEHGGSRVAIDFCRKHGFDYVSCSPFRVPVARLSAAQLALADRLER